MLTELLYAVRDARPDAEAIVCGDRRLSFAALVDRIERLAHGLASRGVGPGDAVALLLPNGVDFVVAVHAVTGIGAVIVPLNPQFKHDELERCFRDAEVRAVITDDPTAGVSQRIVGCWRPAVDVIAVSAAHGQGLTLEALIDEHAPWRLPPRAADEPFAFGFSSGSTGRPKLVVRTHGNVRAEAGFYGALGLGPDDGIFCTVPLFHTYGLGCCLLASAGTGARLVVLEEPNPFLLQRHRALRTVERERPTFFPGVPFHFRLLAEAPGEADLSSLRLAASAGTALPRSVFDAFRARFGIAVRQLYGSTETGSLTVNLDPDPDATSASVGTPLPGVRVAIVGDEGEPLASGETGEVAVSSPAMTAGYEHAASATADAFFDGWFRTGDVGRLDERGRLELTGRRKLFIDVGGYKVDPIEVQDVVESHPDVVEAIVVGAPGAVEGEEVVKAIVVAAPGCEPDDVVRFCRQRLANYKAPQLVELRDEIPRNPMGKVLRKYLV